jgi:hypothetical protein
LVRRCSRAYTLGDNGDPVDDPFADLTQSMEDQDSERNEIAELLSLIK